MTYFRGDGVELDPETMQPKTPAPLEAELNKILDGYGRWMIESYTKSFDVPLARSVAGIAETAIKPSQAKSQLKQLILKEKLRAVLEVLPEKKGDEIDDGFLRDGYNQALDDMEQSARKRYQ